MNKHANNKAHILFGILIHVLVIVLSNNVKIFMDPILFGMIIDVIVLVTYLQLIVFLHLV